MNGKTVLVVDDHTPTREAYAAYLTECGYRVLQAEHGGEAILHFHGSRPDVVLLDLAMPVVDGVEMAESLRRYLSGPRARILAVTGCAPGRERDRMLSLCDDLLEKPCDPAAIEVRIRTLAEVAA